MYMCGCTYIFKIFNNINEFLQIEFFTHFFVQCDLVSVQIFIGETFCFLVKLILIFLSLSLLINKSPLYTGILA